eukprot:gene3763-13824_t
MKLSGRSAPTQKQHAHYPSARVESSVRPVSARGWSSLPQQQQQQQQQRSQRLTHCRATLDDAEIAEYVVKWEAMRVTLPEKREKLEKTFQLIDERVTPPETREKLEKTFKLIDEVNSNDPQQINDKGKSWPYRVIYSNWVSEWVRKIDPKASDEMLILAKGRNIESWRLSEIKRDDYAPTSFGQKQWQQDRTVWLTKRLADVMKEAGYDEDSISLVSDFMQQNSDIPDPNDIRKSDLVGPLGSTNYRLLELASMTQVLRDADAMVLLEHSFEQMFDRMTAEEILKVLKRELSRVSEKCIVRVLGMPWNAVAKKLILKALPAPRRYGNILKQIEGVAAASNHPGDGRYKDFDYE